MKTKICQQCNKEFKRNRKFSKKQWYKTRFCSLKCFGITQRGKKISEQQIKIMSEKQQQYWKDHPEKLQQAKEFLRKLAKERIGKPNVYLQGEKNPNWKEGIASGKNRKEYVRFKALERIARKLNDEGSHTQKEWEELKKKYNYMCLCCKKYEPEITLSEDHKIPLSKGGSDFIENIQPLCRSCNSIKHNKIIDFTKAGEMLIFNQ